MEKYEIHKFLEEYKQKLMDMHQALKIDTKEPRLNKLNEEIQAPEFWGDPKHAQIIIGEANALKDTISSYNSAKSQYNDIEEMVDLALEDTDAMALLEESIEDLKNYMSELEKKALFSGKYDFNNCILELHPGAGGTESMDWADMLYRMYTRFCARKGFKTSVIDFQAGDEAGIKSVTLSIEGPYAYGLLKAERGVHRLVRISPFDSNARRHTSFCSCEIAPQIEETSDLVIPEEDLRIDTFCSSGPGGQGVNTTYSAVRVTYIPTGDFVACQIYRSQHENKATAMEILRTRIYERMLEEEAEKTGATRQSLIGHGERSEKIRTYNYPQNRVTDHRIGFTINRLDAIIDGKLDLVISELINEDQKRKLSSQEEIKL